MEIFDVLYLMWNCKLQVIRNWYVLDYLSKIAYNSFRTWCLSITDQLFFVRRSWSRRWTMTTCHVFLFFPIWIMRCTLSDISKIIGKGYNLLCFHRYFYVMLFFIGNSQYFCMKISQCCESAVLFFCFSRPMVLLWTLTLAGGNFSLPAAESIHFHASYMNVAAPHPTPSHPTLPLPPLGEPLPLGYIYIYIYMCISIYLYIYIYMYTLVVLDL